MQNNEKNIPIKRKRGGQFKHYKTTTVSFRLRTEIAEEIKKLVKDFVNDKYDIAPKTKK